MTSIAIDNKDVHEKDGEKINLNVLQEQSPIKLPLLSDLSFRATSSVVPFHCQHPAITIYGSNNQAWIL